jgi:hypothetical protein
MDTLPVHDTHLVPQHDDRALAYFYNPDDPVLVIAWLEGDTVRRKTFQE